MDVMPLCSSGLQFACSVAPKSMKSIMMGLFYLFSGIGSLLGTAIVSILTSQQIWFNKEDHGDINMWRCHENHVVSGSHLDFYFFLLAGIGFTGFLGFLLVAKSFSLDSDMAGPHNFPKPFPDGPQNGKHAEATRTPMNSQPPQSVHIQRSLSGNTYNFS